MKCLISMVLNCKSKIQEKGLVATDAISINLSMSALMPIFQIIQDCALVRSVAIARM